VPAPFHDLVAYQRAARLAQDVYGWVSRWSMSDRLQMGDQLIRASDSVAANIAEGRGRWHAADRRRFYRVARGSLYEVECLLELAEGRGLVPGGTTARTDQIAKPLNGLIRSPT